MRQTNCEFFNLNPFLRTKRFTAVLLYFVFPDEDDAIFTEEKEKAMNFICLLEHGW